MPRGQHSNSKKSFKLLDRTSKQSSIYRWLHTFKHKATDREIAKHFGAVDMNAVRPRITELIQDGYLYESGSTICPTTGRKVRTVKAYKRRKKPVPVIGYPVRWDGNGNTW